MKRNIPWASYILAFVLALGFGSLLEATQEKTTNGNAVSVTGAYKKVTSQASTRLLGQTWGELTLNV